MKNEKTNYINVKDKESCYSPGILIKNKLIVLIRQLVNIRRQDYWLLTTCWKRRINQETATNTKFLF